MACTKRERTGSCSHSQCGFPDQSGYNCIDLITHNGTTFCEAGEGCVKECPYSHIPGDGSKVEAAANAWYEEAVKELEMFDVQDHAGKPADSKLRKWEDTNSRIVDRFLYD